MCLNYAAFHHNPRVGVQVPPPIPSKPSKIIAHERYVLIILFNQYVIKPKLDTMI